MVLTMNENNIPSYLESHDMVSDTYAVQSLGGGISNGVFQVQSDRGSYVVKQPFGNLKVEDDWPADVDRVHNEADATRAYEFVLKQRNVTRAAVPSVEYEDHENHVIVIEHAPKNAIMWKSDLLDGRVDADVAGVLGMVLGAVHTDSAENDSIRNRFSSKEPFLQLRIEPYHQTTADRHSEVQQPIDQEIERVLSVDKTLVHGDYCPKNVLVNYDSEPAVSWILDFEAAHWGDPAFDTAFMLNHLFIKSIYNHQCHDEYTDAARRFWTSYRSEVDWDTEVETVRELGILMLARMDGKSPVEYVQTDRVKNALRSVAKTTLLCDITTLDEFILLTDEESEQLED